MTTHFLQNDLWILSILVPDRFDTFSLKIGSGTIPEPIFDHGNETEALLYSGEEIDFATHLQNRDVSYLFSFLFDSITRLIDRSPERILLGARVAIEGTMQSSYSSPRDLMENYERLSTLEGWIDEIVDNAFINQLGADLALLGITSEEIRTALMNHPELLKEEMAALERAKEMIREAWPAIWPPESREERLNEMRQGTVRR